jgi:hypothetical protein
MRTLRTGWEIAGAVSICIALASVFIYLAWLIGWYTEPTTTDVIVAVVLTSITLFLFIWSPPDQYSER